MRFVSKLRVEVLGDEKFKLIEPLVIKMRPEVNLPTVVIPEGYVTDFGTIPKTIKGYLQTNTRHAAVPHDYAISEEHLLSTRGTKLMVPRKMADKIFYYGLRARGVGKVKAWLMYRGVRAMTVIKTRSFK